MITEPKYVGIFHDPSCKVRHRTCRFSTGGKLFTKGNWQTDRPERQQFDEETQENFWKHHLQAEIYNLSTFSTCGILPLREGGPTL